MSTPFSHWSDIDLIALCYDEYPALYARLQRESTRAELEQSLLTLMERNAMTPQKTHLHFTGRANELQTVQSRLESQPLVGIIGLGGMGKTTLALELIERVRPRYQAEVWTSAKYQQFSGGGIVSDSPTATAESLEQLYREIIRQAIPAAKNQAPSLDEETVRQWLAEHPTLIILDNFETVREPAATAMLQGLHRILGQGRVLITSRHQLNYEMVHQFELPSLNETESIDFLRQEANQRGVSAMGGATLPQLRSIYSACGGQPLAMRLVVGQLSTISLSRVLGYLSQPHTHRENENFYRFIYQFSWEALDNEARHLLVAMGAQMKNEAIFADELAAITADHVLSFDAAINSLSRFSLVEVLGGLEKQYQLHPLTFHFVKTDITKEW